MEQQDTKGEQYGTAGMGQDRMRGRWDETRGGQDKTGKDETRRGEKRQDKTGEGEPRQDGAGRDKMRQGRGRDKTREMR